MTGPARGARRAERGRRRAQPAGLRRAGSHGAGALARAGDRPRRSPFLDVEMPHGSTELPPRRRRGGDRGRSASCSASAPRSARRDRRRRARRRPTPGSACVLNRKYYVDELYDAVVVRPLVWLSRVVLWHGVDQGVVDGAAVNGAAELSQGLGWLGSRLQTGQVGLYVVLFLVGALWVLRAVIR